MGLKVNGAGLETMGISCLGFLNKAGGQELAVMGGSVHRRETGQRQQPWARCAKVSNVHKLTVGMLQSPAGL